MQSKLGRSSFTSFKLIFKEFSGFFSFHLKLKTESINVSAESLLNLVGRAGLGVDLLQQGVGQAFLLGRSPGCRMERCAGCFWLAPPHYIKISFLSLNF